MFAPACIDYVTSRAHFHTMPPLRPPPHTPCPPPTLPHPQPALFLVTLISPSHSLFCSLFFPLSLCLPLSLSLSVFSSGCYISIMQPLPASEGERIRPTLPSVVPCQPRLYILLRRTATAATLAPHIWSGADRIIINGKQGTHSELATS